MKKNKTTARRKAREFALQYIYSWIITGSNQEDAFNDVLYNFFEINNFRDIDKDWCKILISGILQNCENLRSNFTPYLDRPLRSISPIEHAILLIGSFELIEHMEIPYRVIINESVELAKSFGGTDGFKFINGVLDKMANSIRAN
ncbi:transcription antitermination factor NusB [Candidatus Kinetoplastidibacterium crithidiae]|uniref:Transcription antitermination protein NusB n=1 Tax=Candidatus Kinetoplastidibacterium crithidiae TCC036E TaxID=1208918 RepID=M1LWF8_9PROT|nr:transcription antitermination factor NusB [Candidatus Kinetoplastibacterium crithidii]AFZ82783.1 N utilization substance protein B [Candidatus Kinetoplastibacterium crithidii (ex Angomonas deanei ATCC 30255)]AGF47564.1 N-utilization substance protein B [Candidatus Kinetoplastibacterium crithidii TCC036E]